MVLVRQNHENVHPLGSGSQIIFFAQRPLVLVDKLGGSAPPYPPRGLFGPKVGVSNRGVGPFGDLGSPLGLPRAPPGPPMAPSEGTLGPQRPVEKTLMSLFDSPTSDLAPLQSNFARSGEATCPEKL